MTKRLIHLKAVWLACAVITLLATTACSAQPQPVSTAPTKSATTEDASDGALQPGEYITKKGWGRLLLKERNGTLMFSLESITGEDTCGLDGTIQGGQGIARNDDGAICKVDFASTGQGINVSAATPIECKDFCGYNGDFEASYLRVNEGCGHEDLDRTRADFKRLYDDKDYKTALATLSPVLTNCLPTLEWEEEGAIRNDLALTQHKNGLNAQCLATLDKYAEDAGKDDDAVIDGWTPALADRYLAIVKAARTNIGLCRKSSANE